MRRTRHIVLEFVAAAGLALAAAAVHAQPADPAWTGRGMGPRGYGPGPAAMQEQRAAMHAQMAQRWAQGGPGYGPGPGPGAGGRFGAGGCPFAQQALQAPQQSETK